MKKAMYVLIVSLIVVSGLVFANHGINNQVAKKSAPTPPTEDEKNAARKKWEATPEGMKYKAWEASPEGKKVFASAATIRKNITDYSNMEAVITSLSLPPGSRLGFGVMARINGADFIITFDAEKAQLEQLQSLRVNDKIILKSHNVSHAPKYAYPILSVEYAERNGKEFFKRVPPKGGC